MKKGKRRAKVRINKEKRGTEKEIETEIVTGIGKEETGEIEIGKEIEKGKEIETNAEDGRTKNPDTMQRIGLYFLLLNLIVILCPIKG